MCCQVLKIAHLAERYVTDYTWYVDIVIKLIRLAGDYVVDEVWRASPAQGVSSV